MLRLSAAEYDEGTVIFFMTEIGLLIYLAFTSFGANAVEAVRDDNNPITFGILLTVVLLVGMALLYLTLRESPLSEFFVIYAMIIIFVTAYLSSITYMIAHENATGWDRWYGAASMVFTFIFLFRAKEHLLTEPARLRVTRTGLAYCAGYTIIAFATIRSTGMGVLSEMSLLFSVILLAAPFLPFLPKTVAERAREV